MKRHALLSLRPAAWLQLLGLSVIVLLSGCSIQKYAMDMISDAVTSSEGASVFTSDNDPQLIADAMPFAIKFYESLLAQNPGHSGLVLTTGSLYVMYANAFIQTPTLYMPPEDYRQQQSDLKRARNLYLRGSGFFSDYLEGRHPGFSDALSNPDDMDAVLGDFSADDVPYAYWYCAGLFGAISVDSFDFSLTLKIPVLMKILNTAYALDPTFNDGALDELYIQVYAAIPESLGGSREKATEAYVRVMDIQQGRTASPYISYALAVVIPRQDRELFIDLMNKALAVDVDAYPEYRLLNTISQTKARWYLDHIDDYFL